MSLGSLSTDMYLPALPTIAETYGVSTGIVQLTLTTFLVGFCGGQLIWGPDRGPLWAKVASRDRTVAVRDRLVRVRAVGQHRSDGGLEGLPGVWRQRWAGAGPCHGA